MSLRKFGLLVLVAGFGGTVETAWRFREQVGFGSMGWQMFGGRFHGASHNFDEQARETLPAGTSLEVDNAFGAVRVRQGAAGEAQLTLHKVVFRGDENRAREFAGRVRLERTLANGVLRVTTNRSLIEAAEPSVGFHTHLELVVPPGTAVKVTNDHGAVEVVDAASANVTASFEDVRLERITGDAIVDSRHASVSASTVGGRVQVAARHDRVSIHEVTGPVWVRNEHGDVTLRAVGTVDAEISFAALEAEDVRGDLTVRGRRSAVDARRVAGAVSIETGYENVHLREVTGNTVVHVDRGGIEASDLKGTLEARGSYEGMTLSRIEGLVKVDLQHGGLDASSLSGGAEIRANGDDVSIDGFTGPLQVVAERASVHITTTTPVTAAISASTTHGGIQLTLPASSRVSLEATSRSGETSVNAAGFTITRSEPSHVVGHLGGGGTAIRLEAHHGDVVVDSTITTAQSLPAPAATPLP